jgi:hypothetical protein
MRITLHGDNESEYLVRGVEYTVFALYLEQPIEFMIQVDSLPAAPYSISSDDVDIVDNRLSRFWVFGNAVQATKVSNARPAILAFPEWVNDVGFFQKIVEGEGGAGDIWREYKEKMELEFASSDLVKTAILLDNGWLQCVNCSNAWTPDLNGEVVSCPSCSTKQKRPLV